MNVNLADWLGRHIYTTGEYEPGTTKVLTALLGPGDTFVDIGANAGYFSLLASKLIGPKGCVCAFEPVPVTRQELLTNLQINKANNVMVFTHALSNAAGKTQFSVGPVNHRGTSSLRSLEDSSAIISVETAPLDQLVPGQHQTHVIKIDIEGAEQLAIEGMTMLLARDHPDLIIELTDLFLGSFHHTAESLCQILKGLGYRMYRIEHNDLVEFKPGNAASTSQFNALFTTRKVLPSPLQVRGKA